MVVRLLFLLLIPLTVFAADNTYTNPIIHADYSDPDVIRVGDDFYLTASSFNAIPGLPILHSKDLVNWRIIGHALPQQTPADVFARPQHGNGVWAPAIRFHNSEFYIFYGDPDFGIYMLKARNAAGPWSKPVLVKAAKGWIDPAPFWDEDGNAYLVHAWANSRSGIKSILTINRMSADGTRLLDEGRMVFDGRAHHPTIEGPKLYKRNGYYYIFAPAGGVKSGWQTALRSKNIYGPYEDRVVMDQGRTKVNGPHQGAWVELQSGESWFVHFQDHGAFGRIVHLQPLRWIDDWPVIGNDADGDGKGEPVASYRKPSVGGVYPSQSPAQTTDEFNERKLGLQWQWHANALDSWFSFAERRGQLSLTAMPQPADAKNLWAVPNLLLQKLPAENFTIMTLVDASHLRAGERSGLLMMGRDYSYIAAVKTQNGVRVVHVVCHDALNGTAETEGTVLNVKSRTVFLRVNCVSSLGDVICNFSYSANGQNFRWMNDIFVAQSGMWIGAKVGLFALGPAGAIQRGQATTPGHADYDWFRFSPPQRSSRTPARVQ